MTPKLKKDLLDVSNGFHKTFKVLQTIFRVLFYEHVEACAHVHVRARTHTHNKYVPG